MDKLHSESQVQGIKPSWRHRCRRLLQAPVLADEEQTRLARSIHVLCLFMILLLPLTILPEIHYQRWAAAVALGSESLLSILFFQINRRGLPALAARWLLVSATALVIFLLTYAGDGFHDPAVVALPGILAFGGMLLERRSFIVLSLLAISSIVAIGLSEMAGWLEFTLSSFTKGRDVIDITIIFTLTAAGIGVLAENLRSTIQQLKKNERILGEKEAHYRLLAENASDVIWTMDENGLLAYLSPSVVNLFGYTHEELTGQPFSVVLMPAALEMARAKLKQVEAVHAAGLRYTQKECFEFEGKRKDGSLMLGEVSAGTIYDPAGKFLGILGITREITDRKRMELELLAAHQQFQSLFDQTPLALTLTSLRDDCLRAVNPGFIQMTGYSREELIGRRTEDLSIWEDPARRVELCERVTSQGIVHNFEARLRSKNGNRVEVLLSAFELQGVAEPCLAIFSNDITQRKMEQEEYRKLESQLQQAQRLESLGILAGGIAHDFNNLLTVIVGNTGLAIQEIPGDSEAQAMLQDINKAAHKATELSRQMSTYAGQSRFTSYLVNLSDVVRDMNPMLEVSLSKKTTLQYQLNEGLPFIKADPSQISQIILNLVSNAVEALEEKVGIITITTGQVECSREFFSTTHLDENQLAGPYVLLEVRDTGTGILPELVGRIFDPFYTTKFTGRGLGLAAVLGIVRSHHGALKVTSALGQGTTFQVFFPAASPTSLEMESPDLPPRQKTGRSILVVDDEEDIRKLASRILAHCGFPVLEAANGREAIEIFSSHKEEIGCVLLDLTMPQMDGEETYRELSRLQPDVRVIISSGYGEKDIAGRFQGKRIAGFIHKPYQMQKLKSLVQDVLDSEWEG